MKLWAILLFCILASVQAGKKMKKCKAQVQALTDELQAKTDELQAKTDELQAKQEALLAKEAIVEQLKEDVEARGGDLEYQKCSKDNSLYSLGGGQYMVDATDLKWPADGMCAVRSLLKGKNDASYTISTELYNWNTNTGHLGIMYNAKDLNNYDFIYIRPLQARAAGCFQTGAVVNGVVEFGGKSVSSACPGHSPRVTTWFNLRLEVNDNSLKVFLDDKLLTEQVGKMVHPNLAMGGVIVPNGYANKVSFRNLAIN